MNERCSNCKFWIYGTVWGECKLGKTNYGVEEFPESTAIAEDDETYHAKLLTKSSHHCNQWKEMQ